MPRIEAPALEPVVRVEDELAPPGRWWSATVKQGYVVMVFRKVLRYDENRATKHMLEVHEEGRSVVWSGERSWLRLRLPVTALETTSDFGSG